MPDTRIEARVAAAIVIGAILVASVILTGCGKDPESPSEDRVTVGETAAPTPDEQKAQPPVRAGGKNVVWILLDACRADHLACYGYPRSTSPNIDALAARGTLFERNYAQGPNTLLSVPTYMTGRFSPVSYQDPRHIGIWFLRVPHDDEVLISTIFAENGYETAMFSSSPWYTAKSRLGASFDTFRWLAHGPRVAADTYEERNPALFQWVEEHAQGANPFFLYVHSLDTHEPRFDNNTLATWLDPSFPPERDSELRRWTGAPFSAADQRHLVDLYDGAVAYADGTVGELVRKLESLGILEDTVVIISADHGEVLGQDGNTLGHPGNASYDDLLRTPLIVAGPGFPANRRVASMTQNADLAPTLVELLELETTARFDGASLFDAIHGPGRNGPDDFVYARSKAYMSTTEPNRIFIFDDIKFDISPYSTEEMAYLGILPRPRREVWTVPDRAGARRAATAQSHREQFVDNLLADRFLPMWLAKDQLPKETPPRFFINSTRALPVGSITSDDSPTDNKWALRKMTALGFMFNEMLLVSHASSEDAPSLVFGPRVPNGTYNVSVFSTTLPSEGAGRGASFNFLVAGEKKYRLFVLDAPTEGERNEAWFDVGTYTVTNGQFQYWVDEGNREDLSVLGMLRFTKVGAEADLLTEDEQKAEQDRLRALGYLRSL